MKTLGWRRSRLLRLITDQCRDCLFPRQLKASSRWRMTGDTSANQCSAELELCRIKRIPVATERSLEVQGSSGECVPMHAPVESSPTDMQLPVESLVFRGKRMAWRGLVYPLTLRQWILPWPWSFPAEGRFTREGAESVATSAPQQQLDVGTSFIGGGDQSYIACPQVRV